MKKIITALFLIIFCASIFAQTRPGTINISYVDTPFNLQIMVMRDRRMLENAFAPLGITVKWYPFYTGADSTRAMAASSIDIASVINSTSIIVANAAGNPVQIAALVSRPRQTFALMAGPGGPRNVRDLKGKTIAGPKGSVLHQMLIAALAREGMKSSDVKFIHMELPAARAALLSKQVDAALQAGSLIISNEAAGLHTIISADGYINPLLFTAVRPAFAKSSPELLQIYLQVQAEAYDWIAAHQAEAIAIGCRLLQIPTEDGNKLYAWSGMAKTMEESDIRALQADVDFLYKQKMIERKINPRQLVLPSAFGK